jgi:uncharacterized membrane-anchored protein YitT (DUF2179 family)
VAEPVPQQAQQDGEPGELAPLAPIGPPHSRLEDGVALLTGTFLVSFGLYLLTTVSAVTGGTAGVALLAAYGLDLRFGPLYVLVNVPFLLLAAHQLGWRFVARTLVAVALVAGFTELHPELFEIATLATPYAVVVGNLLIGIGMLMLFRHGASLGGFNVVALLTQQRLGWRAGYVQMALDVAVILAALAMVEPGIVLWSALGGAVLNMVLALNHRPGRYLGA